MNAEFRCCMPILQSSLKKLRVSMVSDKDIARGNRVCGCTPICCPHSSSHSLLWPWGTRLAHIGNCMSMKTSSMLFVDGAKL